MAKLLGPVLQFLGVQQNKWRVSVLVVSNSNIAPLLQSDAADITPFTIFVRLNNGVAWRAEISIPLIKKAQNTPYTIDGKTFIINTPAANQAPRMAYVSCNGFSSPSLIKQVKDKNAMWSRLAALHTGREKVRGRKFGPYHLLLMGGDQIYSDSIWQDANCPNIVAWCQLPQNERRLALWSKEMEAEVALFYENLYLQRWSQPEVAAMLSATPTVMMWDDHDIFDGWGSYPLADHDCAVYQGIFKIARRYFSIFQKQCAPDAQPNFTLPKQNAFNTGFQIADIGLLVLDMRSERSPERRRAGNLESAQVMSETSWNAVYNWLNDAVQKKLKHLIIMSSIPVVHPSFELLEKMLGVLPGQQELEDDLRDHWTSPSNRAERLRFIHRLFEFSENSGCRVTILSGDVHVAAVGVLESRRDALASNAQVINQLTSSGIVHPAPPAIARFFLEQACQKVEVVDRGITASMLEFPTTARRLIGARNFITIEPDDVKNTGISGNRLWVNWWVEGEGEPTSKVIHGVS